MGRVKKDPGTNRKLLKEGAMKKVKTTKIVAKKTANSSDKKTCWKCGCPCWRNDVEYCWDCYKYEYYESK